MKYAAGFITLLVLAGLAIERGFHPWTPKESAAPPAISARAMAETAVAQPLPAERRAAVLAASAPEIQRQDASLAEEQAGYRREYAQYLRLREKFSRRVQQTDSGGGAEFEATSAELDTALLKLKERSARITQATAQMNQALLAEYEAKNHL